MYKKLFIALAFVGITSVSVAQYSAKTDATYVQLADTLKKTPENWFNLDYDTDKVRGVSTEKAYAELLKDKKSKTVIVAIIDSGIDTEHEDLKDKIWVNEDEVAGNGIDDDKNGYVDDVNGWNFIGNAKGEMIDDDNLEVTRLYVKYKDVYEGKTATDFKGKKRDEFEMYQKVKATFEKKRQEALSMSSNIGPFLTAYNQADSTIKAFLKKDEYTMDEVNAIESEEEGIARAKQVFATMTMMGMTGKDLVGYADYLKDQLDHHYNPDFDPRALVGDDYSNKKEKYYGNNKVKGPDSRHGTHVAGIVGANRSNNIGMKGVANDVKIMVLRTVPNGDERDKDVANSIYYAVKNGAQIINMSFGKAFSPYKEVVDKAVKYAEKKGVLLVHAAGNDSKNTDVESNFPYPEYKKSKKWCKTWVEVGASSWEDQDEFVANFSNYGEKTVTLFAPGNKVYSTTPENTYEHLGGTSMAAPVVTGVAALVLSYYPDLEAEELRDILIKSVVKYGDVDVNIPGEKGKTIKFSKLCSTGGIVNAYNALKLAESYKK